MPDTGLLSEGRGVHLGEVPTPQGYTQGLLCGDSEYYGARYHLEKGQHATDCLSNSQRSRQTAVGSQRNVQTLATWGQGESTYSVVPLREMGCSEIRQIQDRPSLACCY